MIEIDLGSSDWAAVLSHVERTHGPVAHAARWLTRLFVLGSPWAPGLHFVGGRADPRRAVPDTRFPGLIDVSAVGIAQEQALVSCLGETAERLSQLEWPGDVRPASLAAVRERLAPAALRRLQRQREAMAGAPDLLDWMPTRRLGSGEETLVPADWVLRRTPAGPLWEPATPLSSGTAAGRTWEAAAARALLELVERDAAALWWQGGRRGRPLDDAAAGEAAALVASLRRGATRRATRLIDITTDVGIPVIVAFSADRDGRGLVCGVAARLSAAAAARAAILEMCQLELGLQLSGWKAGNDPAALVDVDHRHLARAARIDANACALLHPVGEPGVETAPPSSDAELAPLAAIFARQGIEAVLCDVTRAAIGVPVAWAAAPDLQLYPSGHRTERLARAEAEFGGGAQHVGDVSLM